MKKYILLAVLAGSVGAVQAQTIAAGTIALGGSIGYSYSESNNHDTFTTSPATYQAYANLVDGAQFVALPAASYFVSDNLAVGLNVVFSGGYRDEKTDYASTVVASRTNNSKNRTLGIGPFVQYYKMLTAQFGITGRLGGGYQHIKETQTTNDYGISTDSYQSNVTGSGYYADLTPGIIFLPISKFSVSASMGALNFNRVSTETTNSSSVAGVASSAGYEGTNNNFGARFGLDYLVFGGAYYFGR